MRRYLLRAVRLRRVTLADLAEYLVDASHQALVQPDAHRFEVLLHLGRAGRTDAGGRDIRGYGGGCIAAGKRAVRSTVPNAITATTI